MTKRYKVESYDRWSIPDPYWYNRGEFDNATEALSHARNLVAGSLEGLYRSHPNVDAEALMGLYRAHGEVASIFGDPPVAFHAYHFAAEHARKVVAWGAAGEWWKETA